MAVPLVWKFPSATAINRDWPFGDCTVAKGDEKITLPAAGPVNVTNPAKKTRRPAEVWPLYGMTRRWVYAANWVRKHGSQRIGYNLMREVGLEHSSL